MCSEYYVIVNIDVFFFNMNFNLVVLFSSELCAH